MKKYLIIIKFKTLPVVRMYIGAANSAWAQQMADTMLWNLWKGQSHEWRHYEALIEEVRDSGAGL